MLFHLANGIATESGINHGLGAVGLESKILANIFCNSLLEQKLLTQPNCVYYIMLQIVYITLCYRLDGIYKLLNISAVCIRDCGTRLCVICVCCIFV